jgi:hypothetical protein
MEPADGTRIESPVYNVIFLRSRYVYPGGRLALAMECLGFAAEAEDDRERQIFLEMADAWTVVGLRIL